MITVIATGFDPSRKREPQRREPRRQAPVPVSVSRARRATSCGSWSASRPCARRTPSGSRGRSAVTYGPTGALERQPAPVPVQPTPPRRPLPDRPPTAAALRRPGPGDPELPPPGLAGGEGVTLRGLGLARRSGRGRRLPRRPRARPRRGRRRLPARRPRPGDVTLVAVSKTVDAARLRAAVAAGLTILGENRVQEAEVKAPLAAGRALAPDRPAAVEQGPPGGRAVRRHRVGRFGRPGRAGWTGSPARLRPGAAGRLPPGQRRRDEAKAGFLPETLEAELPALAGLSNLRLLGLMTVGRLVGRPEEARPTFVRCASCRNGCAAGQGSWAPGSRWG